MKPAQKSLASTVLTGVVTFVPIYLCALVVMHAVDTLTKVLKPLTKLVPDALPLEPLIALVALLLSFLMVGLAVRTAAGQAMLAWLDTKLDIVPGYTVYRSLSRQVTGDGDESTWQPALIEIEEALVPGFIIEEVDAGHVAVFVPSVPTPLAGATYIIDRARVHVIDVPITQMVKTISRWGTGSAALMAAKRK